MSQIFDIGPRFYFMKYRKIIMKNNKNLPVFLHKKKTKAYFKILRHGCLQMNVINMLVNFQNDKCHIKREILDKKLKVKK